jgi:hypothetical protein
MPPAQTKESKSFWKAMMKVHEKLTDVNQIKAHNAIKETKLKAFATYLLIAWLTSNIIFAQIVNIVSALEWEVGGGLVWVGGWSNAAGSCRVLLPRGGKKGGWARGRRCSVARRSPACSARRRGQAGRHTAAGSQQDHPLPPPSLAPLDHHPTPALRPAFPSAPQVCDEAPAAQYGNIVQDKVNTDSDMAQAIGQIVYSAQAIVEKAGGKVGRRSLAPVLLRGRTAGLPRLLSRRAVEGSCVQNYGCHCASLRAGAELACVPEQLTAPLCLPGAPPPPRSIPLAGCPTSRKPTPSCSAATRSPTHQWGSK